MRKSFLTSEKNNKSMLFHRVPPVEHREGACSFRLFRNNKTFVVTAYVLLFAKVESVAITVCHLQLATGDFADFQRLDSAVGEVQDKRSGCTHIILVVIITIVSKCAIGVLVGNVVTVVGT